MTEGVRPRAADIASWRVTDGSDAAVSVERLLDRLREVDPDLRAFVPEPGRGARLRRQVEEAAGREPGPLHGVPVGVKDIFHVDGLQTRAGSRIAPERLAGPQATAVTRLLAAGALVAGKTATTEFAFFAPGPTRNPWDPTRTPGGSSSGSAAAVAAGIVPLALGTQTIGSISRPAAYCGVVGFKPTWSRISVAGVIPLSPLLDHVGLFASNTADAALAASVLSPDWRRGDLTHAKTRRREGEEVRAATPLGAFASSREKVSDPRSPGTTRVLGIPEGPYLERAEEAGLASFRSTCERLAEAGWTLRRVPLFREFEEIVRRHWTVMAAEAARVHAKWYPELAELYHPRTRELLDRGRAIGDAELAEARRGREALRAELAAAAGGHDVDLWISPAAPGPAPVGLASTGDPIMNLPWTQAGVPTVALPSDRTPSGLPLGLQVAAAPGRDESLLAAAGDLEGALAPGRPELGQPQLGRPEQGRPTKGRPS